MGSNKKRSSAYSSENMENKKKKKPKMNADVTSSSLPELPLNYFTDLASPDASVREAAAASLVTRLQEIHKQYETLPDKESIDRGLMLEAEKNDGLDNCAPHLRYALRRVIRGVSSSRDRISVESLLKLVSDNLSVSSSLKGQLPIEAVVTHVVEALKLHKWFEQATEVGNPDA
ncbi:hypothetical protein F2Q69_00025432 [Brassica cretica]|uniref:Uncharacterized protein n=1 Tax=Brassica cretica TaxID=69181 RepID=A0A8S9QJC6_BRACR|nr:hypothetical protein F2Q69_00025432 [Brassica cretica]